MDRGCALPGCREAAACPARFCRGHLVTRAVKARHTWSLTAKLLGLIALVALLALPRPWKAWAALPLALAAASTTLFLRAGQVIAGRESSGKTGGGRLPPAAPI